MFDVYSKDKRKAKVLYENQKHTFMFSSSRHVLYEYPNGDFRYVDFRRKYGISKTCVIYNREVVEESFGYKNKKFYQTYGKRFLQPNGYYFKNKFNEIKKELEELGKDNDKLKEPMELPDVEDEKDEIDKELKKSEEELQNQKQCEAKKSQKQSSEKMKEMSAKMQKAMLEMEGESMEENMDDLRKVLENLVVFSFERYVIPSAPI